MGYMYRNGKETLTWISIRRFTYYSHHRSSPSTSLCDSCGKIFVSRKPWKKEEKKKKKKKHIHIYIFFYKLKLVLFGFFFHFIYLLIFSMRFLKVFIKWFVCRTYAPILYTLYYTILRVIILFNKYAISVLIPKNLPSI